MLKDVKWSKRRNYSNAGEHEPLEFYLNSLCNSNSFDLLLGYFSSSAIKLLSEGFAKFIHSGGKVRMVVNTFLSDNDRNAIIKGQSNFNSHLIDFSNLRDLRESLDDYGIHFFECISWLIANKKIEIKVIRPKGKNGIAHYKSGVFSDGETKVGFSASCNFTYYGLLENLESLECYIENEDDRSNSFIISTEDMFKNIFEEKNPEIEYVNAKDLENQILNEFGNQTLKNILENEKRLLERRKGISANKNTLKAIKSAIEQVNKLEHDLSLPRFPYDNPREYQIEAYNNWENNGFKGIFSMATGTGKTLTSLNCLFNEYLKTNFYKAVILVPTVALLKQWKKECLDFNFINIIEISSKNNWPDEISFINSASNFLNVSFVIIVTYSSFHRDKFQNYFKKLPSDTILIADEAHNLGSSRVSKALVNMHLEKRIGLSATINRNYDEIGNHIINTFFNDKAPYIFSYEMKEAIKNGILCKYKYYPHIVELNQNELNEYKIITEKLNKFLDSESGGFINSPIVDILLMKRKQIIHKAENKLHSFINLIENEFQKKGNLDYSLIYVPEGVEPNYEDLDESIENESEIKLIDEYTKAVSRLDSSLIVRQYTANTKDRDNILSEFRKGNVNVLISMKCLDEGVDIPRSELAFFCSSTGNPRQFVQRRGRVLRKHKDKKFAVIHDLVVVPKMNNSNMSFEMQKKIVINELERVIDFSQLADNKIDTYNTFEDILNYYNLNINEITSNQNGNKKG